MTRLQILTRLHHLIGEDFTPQSPADFIGPAREVAAALRQKCEDARAGGFPLRFLLNGSPGVGKTALARYAQHLLGVHPKWSTLKYSGVDVTIDAVRDLAGRLHLRDLFSEWRLIWIEEADKIPAAAQVRFLMLLDEMPHHTAVLCTSNCKLDCFESRFQTRFTIPMPFIGGPTGEETLAWLQSLVGDESSAFPVPRSELVNIATFCCGNVRAALLDALDLFDKPQTQAA